MSRHKLWMVEFFIWLLAIVITVLAIRVYKSQQINKKNTYHIFMQDIDGLMKGSPVKIMGVQVGYVTEVHIIDDYMYVSFLISKKNVHIPYGAKALIESYGIAGSKSIELYPPKQKINDTKTILYVENPIRASSSFITQNEIAKTLVTVAKGTTAMLDTQTVEQHKKTIQQISELSGTKSLDTLDERTEQMIEKIKDFNKRVIKQKEGSENE